MHEFSQEDLFDITEQAQENVDIVKQYSEKPFEPERINPRLIDTDEKAERYFISELARRYRFFQYDNIANQLSDNEMLDALYDAMEEINETPPFDSSFTLLKFVRYGTRYRRLLLLGAAKNCVMTLISIWSSNGMDVQVEDLSVASKLSDFTSLYETLKSQFEEALTKAKELDVKSTITRAYSTGRTRFNTIGNGGDMISPRVSFYSSNGKVL